MTFREYDVTGKTERTAACVAPELREVGLCGEPFGALAETDPDTFHDVLGALGYVDNDSSVAADTNDRPDSPRSRLDTTKEPQSSSLGVFETVQSWGVRSLDNFRAAFVQYVA